MRVRVAVATLLAAALLACGSLALARGGTPRASPSGPTVHVTRADDRGTVRARVGDQIQISLGDAYVWRLDPPDGVVLTAPVQTRLYVRGTQAVWLASAPGTTTISATGTLPCPSGRLCAMIAVQFSTTLVVSK